MKTPLPIQPNTNIERPATTVGAASLLEDVKYGIAGLKDRLRGVETLPTPASYVGPSPTFIFQPETTAFALDVAQANGTTALVNYIIRSGTTYQFPISIGGAGIFLAQRFRINLMQRLYVNVTGQQNVAQAPVMPMVNGFWPSQAVYWTTKFSCFPVQPATNQSPSINYRWNISDPVRGEQYSDKMLPASALLNRRYVYISQGSQLATAAVLFDGDWFEFDAPWRFDRAGTVQVDWRPVTDIVQFDSSISGTTALPNGPGLPYDDRVGGIRNQGVTVQVEFQGERIGG